MKGMFIHDYKRTKYAWLIVRNYKDIETRSRDMLKNLVGDRVAVVSTKDGQKPMVVGYVDIVAKSFCSAKEFDRYFPHHFVQNGCDYYCNGKGKWFYHLENAEACEPYPLPSSAVRHGRSWCEF